MTTHVANASKKDIYARVGVSRKKVTSEKRMLLNDKVAADLTEAGEVCLSVNLVKIAFYSFRGSKIQKICLKCTKKLVRVFFLFCN